MWRMPESKNPDSGETTDGAVPTSAQAWLIERATEVAQSDERILAAWLAGSFATGTADAYSDIDLHCAISDDSAPWFRDHWADLARQISPVVLASPLPGLIGGYAITPGWLHFDIVMHQAGHFDSARAGALRPLFDRTGTLLPAETVAGPDPHGEPYFPAEVVDFYFYLLGNLVVVLGRGETILASNGSVMRRDVGLVPLMLAENGVKKSDGNKRLNRYLTGEQRAFLESLPPVSVDCDAVVGFDSLVAAEFIRRGRALADRTGARWPADLERATLDYLRSNVDPGFGS
jgi:hypothetical protein